MYHLTTLLYWIWHNNSFALQVTDCVELRLPPSLHPMMYQSVPTVGHPGLHLRLLPSIFSMIYQSSPSKDLLKHIKDVPQSTGEPGVSVTSLCLFWKTTIRICIFCCCINYIWRRFFISRKRKFEHHVILCQPTRLRKVWIQRHQFIWIWISLICLIY